MKLADWRIKSGRTQEGLAAELQKDKATIYRWEKGWRVPGTDDLQAIFIVSEGEVQPNDFFDLPLWRRLLAQAVERVRGRAA